MKTIPLIILFACTTIIGCYDFEPVHLVTKLKVLAVSSEPPEFAPGQGTTLSILWADPKGEGRQVQFAWVVCAGYVHGSEGLSTCEPLAGPHIETEENGGDSFVIPETPIDLLDELPEGHDELMATAAVIVCAGGSLPTVDDFMNHSQTGDINELCEGGDGVSAFKVIRISNNPNPNRNPQINNILFDEAIVPMEDGGPPITIPCNNADSCGSKAAIQVSMHEGSMQQYETTEFGEQVTHDELLYISWFTTGGEYDVDRSGSEEEIGPYNAQWEPIQAGTYTLWSVAHDNRGGASWKSFTVNTDLPLVESNNP